MRYLPLIIIFSLSAAPGTASGEPPLTAAEREAYMQRLGGVEDRIDRLRVMDRDDWLTPRRADEIRMVIADVLADADQRTSLLEGRPLAGYGKRIYFENADRTFGLEFSGRLQIRHVYNSQQNSTDDDNVSGVGVRRAKLKSKGYVGSKRLRFALNVAYEDETGLFEFQGANISYQVTDETTVRVGRFRSPFFREEEVSSRRQLVAERSLLSRAFTQSRTVGAGLTHETDRARIQTAFNTDRSLDRGDNWLVALRGELLFGEDADFKLARDFTSSPDDDPVVIIGAGVLYREEDPGTTLSRPIEIFRWTVDIGIEFGGANLFAAVVGNQRSEETLPRRKQFGAMVQGGFFIIDQWEVFGRYEWGDAGGVSPDLSVMTVGLNRYFDGHNVKWTMDVGYGFNEVGSFWDSDGAGWRRDRAGVDGQIVVRTQMQLQF